MFLSFNLMAQNPRRSDWLIRIEEKGHTEFKARFSAQRRAAWFGDTKDKILYADALRRNFFEGKRNKTLQKIRNKLALQWYRNAAELGDQEAMLRLAYMYRRGIGTNQSFDESMNWLEKSAKKGDYLAQYNYGYLMYKGILFSNNLKEAEFWLRKSAQQNYPEAQLLLGRIYFDDRSRKAGLNNLMEAKKWLKKSGDLGENDIKTIDEKINSFFKLREICKTNTSFLPEVNTQADLEDFDEVENLINELERFQYEIGYDLVETYQQEVKNYLLKTQYQKALSSKKKLQQFQKEILIRSWLNPENQPFKPQVYQEIIARIDYEDLKDVRQYFEFLKPLDADLSQDFINHFIQTRVLFAEKNNSEFENFLRILMKEDWLSENRLENLMLAEKLFLKEFDLENRSDRKNYFSDLNQRQNAYNSSFRKEIGNYLLTEIFEISKTNNDLLATLAIAQQSQRWLKAQQSNFETEAKRIENALVYFNPNIKIKPKLYPIKVNENWGYINEKGGEVIEPIFDLAFDFENEITASQLYGQAVLINRAGAVVLQNYQSIGEFKDGLAKTLIGDQWAFLNPQGEIEIEAKFDEARDFKNGFSAVKISNYWTFIDKKGKEISRQKYQKVNDFRAGRAIVVRNGKYGFINKSGKEIIKPIYDNMGDFYFNLAWVEKNGKYGYVNKSGKTIIRLKFDLADNFSSQLAPVTYRNQLGYINSSGKMVVKKDFDEVKIFKNGLAKIRMYGKYGFINTKGRLVIEPKFVEVKDFENGMAQVKISDGGFGYINSKGKMLLPPIFESSDLSNSKKIMPVFSNDEMAYFNSKSKIIWQSPNFYLDSNLIETKIETLYFADGEYQGETKYGVPHGKGKRIYNGKGIYEGIFIYGLRWGKGEFNFENGDDFVGNWKYDQPHGFGTLTQGSFTYKGNFKNGKKEGRGELSYISGKKITSTWKNNYSETANKFRKKMANSDEDWTNWNGENHNCQPFTKLSFQIPDELSRDVEITLSCPNHINQKKQTKTVIFIQDQSKKCVSGLYYFTCSYKDKNNLDDKFVKKIGGNFKLDGKTQSYQVQFFKDANGEYQVGLSEN